METMDSGAANDAAESADSVRTPPTRAEFQGVTGFVVGESEAANR
jgi:hypothetical protein